MVAPSVNLPEGFKLLPEGSAPPPPSVSQLGSFGRGAVSMLPLGNQAYAGAASALENKPYVQERQELEQEEQQDKATNPVATLAGKATGLVAPALLTGGASAPESIGEAALQGAGIGAGFGAGNAIDTLASGGTGTQAGADVLAGAGAGALGGGLIKGIGEGLGAGAEALGNTKVGQMIKAKAAAGSLGVYARALSNLAEKEGVTPEEYVNSLPGQIKKLDPKAFQMFGTRNEAMDRFLTNTEEEGRLLGLDRDSITKQTGPVSPAAMNIVNDLKTAVVMPKVLGEEGAPQILLNRAGALEQMIQNGKASFNDLADFRSGIGESVHAQVPGADRAYAIVSNGMNNEVDRAAQEAQSSISLPDYKDRIEKYKIGMQLAPLLRKGASREIAQGTGLSGSLGFLGAVTGHPAAMIPAALKSIENVVAPEAGSNLILGGVNALPESAQAGIRAIPQLGAQTAASQVSPAIQSEPITANPNLGQYKPVFDQMAKGITDPNQIKKRNTVTDFILQQLDPKYAKALTESKNV